MAVEVYGRWFYLVDSHSREDKQHLVDLEPVAYFRWNENKETVEPASCDCESFRLRTDRPCRHIREVANWIIFRMELPAEDERRVRKEFQQVFTAMFRGVTSSIETKNKP